jgi:hypothetical protein
MPVQATISPSTTQHRSRLPLMVIALAALGAPLAWGSSLPVGMALRCEARTPRLYPCTFTVEQFDAQSGRFTGRTDYSSLNSTLRVVGSLRGTRLQFEETEFIGRKGAADLNCVYDMQDKGDRYEGPLQCAHPGTMIIYLPTSGNPSTPPPLPPEPPPSPQPPSPPPSPPTHPTSEGIWTLIGTEIEEYPNCFRDQPDCNTVLARYDGELAVTTTVYDKTNRKTSFVEFHYQWTPPPATLTPRDTVKLPASVTRSAVRTESGWAGRLGVSFVRHGGNSGTSFINLFVGVPPRHTSSVDSDETGAWTVPRPMSDCLKEADGCRMDVRVGIRSTALYARTIRYVYLYRAH